MFGVYVSMICCSANVQGEKRKFQLAGDHQESVEFSGKEAEPDSSLVFAADRLPPQRQLYYQLCDLRDDSLQAIIHSNDGREEKCSVSVFVCNCSTM